MSIRIAQNATAMRGRQIIRRRRNRSIPYCLEVSSLFRFLTSSPECTHGRLPEKRDLLCRQQPDVGLPLVLEMERVPCLMDAAVLVVDGVRSQRAEIRSSLSGPVRIMSSSRPIPE